MLEKLIVALVALVLLASGYQARDEGKTFIDPDIAIVRAER